MSDSEESDKYFDMYIKASSELKRLKSKEVNFNNLVQWKGLRQESPIECFFNQLVEANRVEMYFLTITFDPDRFGLDYEYITDDQKKKYVLSKLQDILSAERFDVEDELMPPLITAIYGCFEYTKNLQVHAHAILLSPQPGTLYTALKPYFTARRISPAIDIQKVNKVRDVLKYIEKESNDYFFQSMTKWHKFDELTITDKDVKMEKPAIIKPKEGSLEEELHSFSFQVQAFKDSQKVELDRFIAKLLKKRLEMEKKLEQLTECCC